MVLFPIRNALLPLPTGNLDDPYVSHPLLTRTSVPLF